MKPMDLKEQLIVSLFPYVLKQPIDFRDTLVQAVENEPEFVAQLSLFFAEVLADKEQAYQLAVALFQSEKGKEYGEKQLLALIRKPEDVLTALHYYLVWCGKPLANAFKKTLEKAFQTFHEPDFFLAKTKEGTVTFADFLHLIHPRPLTEEQRTYWQRLKQEKEKRTLDVYGDLHQMIRQYKKEDICTMIRRENMVSPFRLFETHQFLKKRGVEMEACIQEALNQRFLEAVRKLPEVKGKTFIASDVSPSMNTPLSPERMLTYRDLAQFYMAGASEQCEKNLLAFYASTFDICKNLCARTGLSLLDELERVALGHENDAKKTVQYLNEQALFVDRIILFSDKPTLPEVVSPFLDTYQQSINPSVQIHLFYLAGGKEKVYKQQGIHHYNGWSASFYSLLYFLENTPAQLVEMIQNGQKNTSPKR